MSKKYTYERSIETSEGLEQFSAVEFDSFDEAINAVDRGISDRKNQIKRRIKVPDGVANPENYKEEEKKEVPEKEGTHQPSQPIN